MIRPISHGAAANVGPIDPPKAPASKHGIDASSAFTTLVDQQLSKLKTHASAGSSTAVRLPPTLPPASPQSASSTGSTQPVVYHTPFGDVTVDPSVTTDLQGLFSTKTSAGSVPPVISPPAPPPAPTAQSVFGPSPWMSAPSYTGPDNTPYPYNPIYFATPATAAKVAAMVGGTVVQKNMMAPSGPFQQQQPNYMVQLPNGKLINPGLVADFYNHGYPQSYVDMMIQYEVKNA